MGIPFRIKRVETKQFAMFPDDMEGDVVQVNTKYEFRANVNERMILCDSYFDYKQEDKLILVLQVACYFEIEAGAFESFKKGDEIHIPVEFMRYMGTIAVGTARGIICAKTEGTRINSVVLPPINLVEVMKDDYIFK